MAFASATRVKKISAEAPAARRTSLDSAYTVSDSAWKLTIPSRPLTATDSVRSESPAASRMANP